MRLIDQCGENFRIAQIIVTCVLRMGHKGPHRGTIDPVISADQLRDRTRDLKEQESEEVTLP
jgi:hypothetical protein